MSKSIRPFFESTLAEPARAPGSSIVHAAGARVVFSAELATKKFGQLLFTTPNPVDAFISEASELVGKSDWLLERISKEKPKYMVFSHLSSMPDMTAERAIRDDPDAKRIRLANDDLFYRLIIKNSELLFVLVAGVEAMVNQLVPPTYRHAYSTKNGVVVDLDKAAFEMKVRLEEKLEALARLRSLGSPKSEVFWSKFKEILDLRNDIVHLKTKGQAFKALNDVYRDLIDLDTHDALATVDAVIKYFC